VGKKYEHHPRCKIAAFAVKQVFSQKLLKCNRSLVCIFKETFGFTFCPVLPHFTFVHVFHFNFDQNPTPKITNFFTLLLAFKKKKPK